MLLVCLRKVANRHGNKRVVYQINAFIYAYRQHLINTEYFNFINANCVDISIEYLRC